jgi:nitrogen regulatory protein PII 1
MLMVRAIVRPERCDEVLAALMDAGFPAVTKMDVYGRGKQRGMRAGDVTYDELPKEMFFTVVQPADKDIVIRIIMQAARTGPEGAYGDGKIFVSPVDEVYTVSAGVRADAEVTTAVD